MSSVSEALQRLLQSSPRALALMALLLTGLPAAAFEYVGEELVFDAPPPTPRAALNDDQVAASVARFSGNTRLAALDDASLAGIGGQAGSLFLADKITPNELAGGSSANFTNFTYYRMGMDVKMDMNLNIAKLQLGCGGVNDMLNGPGCDLDIDYMGFMGLNAANDRPSTAGPDSVFSLTRPYIELAIKNDGTAQREVVGIKVGAQKINGAIRLGRDYTGYGGYGQESSLVNAENGGTCNPSATTGAGVVACHSGVNSLSGFLAGVELSAGFLARAQICDILLSCWLFGPITLDIDGCLGRINFSPCTTGDTPFFVEAGGTRLNYLHVAAAQLRLKTSVVIPITLEGYGQLILDTRQIHYLLTPNASDFFLSFQRERVSWPRYEKAPPPNNVAFDNCNPAYGQVPTNGRCSSAYSEPANTGWWLSAGNVKMLNLQPGNRIVLPGSLTLGDLLGALGPSSNLIIDNPKLDFVAQRNCYGSQIFC